ncbi:hypothetical protein RF11_11229 [Thelohanellus kitauei]|uniref:Uncharacterized protein n=1 Tax=Thelohanellus kitauei TaxID=669202 RepID=A0A0C2INW6_THEKT|nr:hypothetical protein RF11_11229 [Thelohanellus kitauei]
MMQITEVDTPENTTEQKIIKLIRSELKIAYSILYPINSELRHSIGRRRFNQVVSCVKSAILLQPINYTKVQKCLHLTIVCARWLIREIKIGFHVNAFFMMFAVVARLRQLLIN